MALINHCKMTTTQVIEAARSNKMPTNEAAAILLELSCADNICPQWLITLYNFVLSL